MINNASTPDQSASKIDASSFKAISLPIAWNESCGQQFACQVKRKRNLAQMLLATRTRRAAQQGCRTPEHVARSAGMIAERPQA